MTGLMLLLSMLSPAVAGSPGAGLRLEGRYLSLGDAGTFGDATGLALAGGRLSLSPGLDLPIGLRGWGSGAAGAVLGGEGSAWEAAAGVESSLHLFSGFGLELSYGIAWESISADRLAPDPRLPFRVGFYYRSLEGYAEVSEMRGEDSIREGGASRGDQLELGGALSIKRAQVGLARREWLNQTTWVAQLSASLPGWRGGGSLDLSEDEDSTSAAMAPPIEGLCGAISTIVASARNNFQGHIGQLDSDGDFTTDLRLPVGNISYVTPSYLADRLVWLGGYVYGSGDQAAAEAGLRGADRDLRACGIFQELESDAEGTLFTVDGVYVETSIKPTGEGRAVAFTVAPMQPSPGGSNSLKVQ